jgi:hypothetical protein
MLNLHVEILTFIAKIFIISFISCAIMQWIAMHGVFGYKILVYDMTIFHKLGYIMLLFFMTGVLYISLGMGLNLNIMHVMMPSKIKPKIINPKA